MPEYSCVCITLIQEEKLKIAVENTCELCHDYYPSLFLEIHRISGQPTKEMRYDPSTRILWSARRAMPISTSFRCQNKS